MQPNLKKQLVDVACAPYRPTGIANYYWARGKLSHDPIFAALIDEGVFHNNMRVIDLGCGRGLLAAWFLAAEQLADHGEWGPNAPPRGLRFRGVELMAREADCGNRALQPLYADRVSLSGGDMRTADLAEVDAIAILDVLHYIPYAEQDRLLDHIRAALGTSGVFVTRVGNAGTGMRFAFSQLVDHLVSFAQGHHLARFWCRPLAEWIRVLEGRGFAVRPIPMSMGTPFANVMLVCQAN